MEKRKQYIYIYHKSSYAAFISHIWVLMIELGNVDIEHFYLHRNLHHTAVVRIYHGNEFFLPKITDWSVRIRENLILEDL